MGDSKTYINQEYQDIRIFLALAITLLTVISGARATPANLNNSVEHAGGSKETMTLTATTEPLAVPTPVVEPVKPKPETKVTAPVYAKGCEHYRHLFAQYNWNVEVALQVAKAESGCNPMAVGDNRVIGGIYAPSCGLMQIRTLAGRPSCEQLKDPATNIAWAYRLYSAKTTTGALALWRPWSVCKNGMVRCY